MSRFIFGLTIVENLFDMLTVIVMKCVMKLAFTWYNDFNQTVLWIKGGRKKTSKLSEVELADDELYALQTDPVNFDPGGQYKV